MKVFKNFISYSGKWIDKSMCSVSVPTILALINTTTDNHNENIKIHKAKLDMFTNIVLCFNLTLIMSSVVNILNY